MKCIGHILQYKHSHSWKILYTAMLSILDKLYPEKKLKFAKERPTWLTNDLVNFLKERHFIFVIKIGKSELIK